MVTRMNNKEEFLERLTNNPCDERVAFAVETAKRSLQESNDRYLIHVGLPVPANNLVDLYTPKLQRQLRRGRPHLGLAETVSVLEEVDHGVFLIHCTSEYSKIILFCEDLTERIVGCTVFPHAIELEE